MLEFTSSNDEAGTQEQRVIVLSRAAIGFPMKIYVFLVFHSQVHPFQSQSFQAILQAIYPFSPLQFGADSKPPPLPILRLLSCKG